MNKKPITLHTIAQDYLKNIIHNVSGMKGIIMDKETQIIVSLEISKAYAINEEIFMFENIEKINIQQKYNVNGIFIIRPNESNLNFLSKILQSFAFKEIYLSKNFIFFSFLIIILYIFLLLLIRFY
jgi:hypothetical protein